MFSRTQLLASAALAVACGLSAVPAQAYDTVSIAPYLLTTPSGSATGACSFLLSGPSLDPSFTPYRIAGSGTVVANKVVVSTSIRCRIRMANVTGNPQHGGTLQRALPGNTTAVAGDVNVTSFGPFLICTMVDAVFEDTSRLNPEQIEQCRPMTRL